MSNTGIVGDVISKDNQVQNVVASPTSNTNNSSSLINKNRKKEDSIDENNLKSYEGGTSTNNNNEVTPEEIYNSLTPEQKIVIDELKVLEAQHASYEKEYEKEWNILKAKYLHMYYPLYSKRRQILFPNFNTIRDIKNFTPLIPNFWLRCMQNNRTLKELIEPRDAKVLSHLIDISFKWKDESKQDSYTLIFTFAPNMSFEPLVLEKTYNMASADNSSESILMSTMSTTINWFPDKDVTVRKIKRKQRHPRTKQTRVVDGLVETSSFFNFFSNHRLPSEIQLEKLNEEEIAELELTIEADYEVGIILREKIIPHAILWYLGEAEDDFSDNDDVASDDDDEDDDDDYDEEDEEDDYDEYLDRSGSDSEN